MTEKDNTMEKFTEQLKASFPELYKPADPREPFSMFGVECGSGWNNIIWSLSEKLEKCISDLPIEDRQHFFVVQIKEKYGTLRFYMSSETYVMSDFIREAEKESSVTCEECGKPGEERTDRSWIVTLCDTCNFRK